ncbi:membrane-bound O-acyltransferase family protein [Massilia eurypsychrophila]|uniref:Probable alginate O-acetylase AlgI n=1 Tax=Massilia eurypsychrophila TaxID=1485217 RepID=A0A2G8T8A1_9BURK|nr:MBOAT family protein [Massilia eurypsychrophila]PIL42280.1 membrane-bound O-acyltransferase family protein [Massilia eurypsychrophila]
MVFSSAVFLFYFFPAFLLCYYALPWKNAVLLIASLVFYAWGEPRFVPLLMASAVLNYAFGRLVDAAATQQWRWRWLVAGVAANLAMLAWFKYMGFFADLLKQVGLLDDGLKLPAIVLPLGISFFTFQGISYLVDLYRRDIAVQSSFWRFAMYKSMFPQLIAGPIVRYSQIAADIDQRSIDNTRVWRGMQLFVLGLAQKVLIANTVAVYADRIFGVDASLLTPGVAWLGVACYAIQILFDFSGYSNMAIGIGHMIGFTFPPNFQRPYSARSVTEFWRRWHMSLSSWFRDYVYIPLGGNRGSPWRTYFNLALVFVLCGLWHGAAWTFVIWGCWHGALLVVERLGLGRLLARLPGPLAQAYTLLCVLLGWVFFRADDVPHTLKYLRAMFGMQASAVAPLAAWQLSFGSSAAIALVVGSILACWRWPAALPLGRTAWRAAAPVLVAAGFVLCVASLAAGTYNPFIYFRF